MGMNLGHRGRATARVIVRRGSLVHNKYVGGKNLRGDLPRFLGLKGNGDPMFLQTFKILLR